MKDLSKLSREDKIEVCFHNNTILISLWNLSRQPIPFRVLLFDLSFTFNFRC